MSEASGTVSHKAHVVMGDTGLVFAITVGFQAPGCTWGQTPATSDPWCVEPPVGGDASSRVKGPVCF